ncbi:RHS repeat-associated core domain-containing protein [Streptomyces sp. NPDC091292]|uniref:RHS repeat-associated core domain-containing protein n=1 Tax=Streptomyces sp. NPDC091292 TaxID=3365991 RepID=UPI0037F7F06D
MGNRPTDWHVLDLDKDPTPGDPDRVRTLAKGLHDFADDVGEALRLVKGMAEEDAVLTWAGKSAKAFQDEFSGVPKNLRKLKKSYEMAGDALAAYWPKLERAQALADKALVKGREAQADLSSAQSRLTSAESWVDRAGKEADKYKDDPTGGKDVPKPDPDKVKAATRDAQSAKNARTSAQSDVSSASNALDAAKKMAADARKMREDAAREAKDKIGDASDAGIQNRKWWEEVGDWFTDNWDTIVAVCKVVVAVVGIIAMIIGGPILGAIVLIAALVVLADTLSKYAKGQATLWDVAFAALDCIPGGKGLTSLGAIAKGMKGMGRALRGGLKSLRSGAKDLLAKAKPYKGRCRGGDPIDMVSGEMLMEQVDLDLAGLLPLVIRRTHISTYRWGRCFGASWASTLDQRLEIDDQGVVFATEDGMLLAYPIPSPDAATLPLEGPRRPLRWSGDHGGVITVHDEETGRIHHFAPGTRRDGADSAYTLPVVAVTDRNGHRIDFLYDEAGDLAEVRHSGGYQVAIGATQGRVTSLSVLSSPDDGYSTGAQSPWTVVRRYGYDAEGHLRSVSDAEGRDFKLTYDAESRITSWTDRNGGWYRYTYDNRHRVTDGRGADGFLDCSLTYDDAARVTTYRNSLGRSTTYCFDARLQLVQVTGPLGASTQREWDEHGRLISWTDPLGRTTRQVFDAAGHLIEVVRPDLSSTRAEYDEAGRTRRLTDPDGAVWNYTYDEHGNRLSVTDPSGATTRYTYDPMGRPVAVTDALGHTRRIETDPAGLPVALTDPQGRTIRARRDSFGRVSAVTDGGGATDRFGWTVEGLASWRSFPDGATEAWSWDGEGNLVSHTARDGAVTAYEFTHFHQPISRTTPDSRRHTFAYDTELNLTGVQGADGRTWEYTYDAANRLVRETDFNDRTLTYTHDAAGQRTSWTNGAGQTTDVTVDLLGRPLQYRTADDVTTYEYDSAGSLLRSANRDTTVERTYDAAGRTLTETVNGRTTTYTYDALGRRTSRRTPSGITSTWTYGATGRPQTLTGSGSQMRFDYDAAHREIRRTLGAAAVLHQSWDDSGRLAEQTVAGPGRGGDAGGTVLQHRTYAYDVDGALREIDELLGESRRFDVDPVGRLTAVRTADREEAYGYDQSGNLLTASPHAGTPDTQPLEFDGTRLRRAGRTTYTYDGQGRLIRRTVRLLSGGRRTFHYAWSPEDRLVRTVTPDGSEWRYSYDPDGRRISKQRLGGGGDVLEQTAFVWDGTRLAEQIEADGTVTTWDYAPGSYRPVAQTVTDGQAQPAAGPAGAHRAETDARFYAIVTDLVGSPTELVSADGRIVWHRRFTAWGKPISTSHTAAEADCPLRFPGQYADTETGCNYNYFRYYDPETARYISADPLGLGPDPNDYAYVTNPLVLLDPLGLVRVRGGGGRWERDANSPQQSHNRDSEYPGSYRQSTHDAMAATWTDEGIAQGGTPMRPTGQLDAQGRQIMERTPRSDLTWRNSAGEIVPSHQLTYEHLTPVVDHWNETGYRSDRATRNDFYNDPDNMEPMTRSENSRGGALMDATYRQDVDPTLYSCS